MKIGIDFRMRGNDSAGIGRYIFELTTAILQQDTVNSYVIFYNVHNVLQSDLDTLSKHSNVQLVATNIRHYSMAEQVRLPKVLHAHNLDVMHFPNFNVPVRYTKPYVVTIHDMVHHRIGGHKKTHYLHFTAYKYIMQKAAERAVRIIAPSHAAAEDIAHFYPHVQKNISVVYEGTTLQPQPEEAVARVKNIFLLRRPYFLFVGTLERKKNIVTLARGFDIFREKYKLDVDLVFAGKVDRHAPDEKYKALHIKHKDNVVFTGFISDADLAALYQGAYAYANASLNEGFGLPGVEAMQWGLPLLVSNTKVFNEIYDSAAIYFDGTDPSDIAEKMHLLVNDTQFYEQQQQKSLKRGVLFSWDNTAKQTIEIYASVFKKVSSSLISDDLIPEN